MARKLGILLQALIMSLLIVTVRLLWAPVWAREDMLIVGACVMVAFVTFLIGFTVTMQCLEIVFGRIETGSRLPPKPPQRETPPAEDDTQTPTS